MDDLLKPVKTTKKVQSNIEKFESLTLKDTQPTQKQTHNSSAGSSQFRGPLIELDPTTHRVLSAEKSGVQSEQLSIATESRKSAVSKDHKHQNSAVFVEQLYLKDHAPSSLSANAREILRNQPSFEDLVAVLQYLQFGIDGRHEFNIRVTSPQAAQIINVLVTVTVADVWSTFSQEELSESEAKLKRLLVSCLSSVAGIGALLVQIKQTSSAKRDEGDLHATISVLGAILKGKKIVNTFLRDALSLYTKEPSRRVFWQEVVALLAGSRVLSITTAALMNLPSSEENLKPSSWLGSGAEYTGWLARNITTAATALRTSEDEAWKLLSQLVKRGMGLGYRDAFVSEIYTTLLLGQRALWTPLHLILQHLTSHDQKSFFDSLLSHLAQKYLTSTGEFTVMNTQDQKSQKIIAGVAALIAGLIKNNDILEEHAIAWVTGDINSSKTVDISLKRALIAVFGESEEKLQRILEKSLTRFSDKLDIQHAPLLQQEAATQTILLVIGYLGRLDVNALRKYHISTLVMHSVSNRLASSIPQTRLLGMIVGTAVSRLVDKEGSVLNFDVEEMESTTTKAWLGLTSVHDVVGNIEYIESLRPANMKSKSATTSSKPGVGGSKVEKPIHQAKIVAIEEVFDSSESEEDDLIPYQKPDSDAEDSDEDPTLINRNKPSAPVYIVDLIKQLQLTDKPDVIELALMTGPELIRRKIAFGTELSDNVYTLATVLINLQEGVSEPRLEQSRLDSLIACIVAKPESVGPFLGDLYFRGDFSLSQRVMLLTAIGLATRELAGFKDQHTATSVASFPSKRLPPHLEPQAPRQIESTSNPVAMLANTVAHNTIRPMALAAADQVTGPAALKVRTFSSRLEVEKRNEMKATARTKTIPKDLHKLLAESIYLALCGPMSFLLSHVIDGGRLPNTTITHSSTLKLHLQTLTLTLHTLGPSATFHLPILTAESLLLLNRLHNITQLAHDPAVLPAMLHLLLALLEIVIEAGVTAQERLLNEHGGKVAELVNWVHGLGNKISVPDAGDGANGVSWTILAAGIQVKWFEMGKRFQGRMLGLTMDEMDQLSGA